MKISEIKWKARKDMKNGYGFAILTMILLNLTLIGSLTIGFVIGLILVAGAVQCCYIAYFNDVASHKREGIDSTYRGFRQFARALALYLFHFLILVVPLLIITIVIGMVTMTTSDPAVNNGISIIGLLVSFVLSIVYLVYYIIMSIKLYLSFYILNDEIDLSALECIKKSIALTKGNMGHIFLFELSFIGWWLLCLITLGGMYLYVYPYYMTARSNLYFDLAGKNITPSTSTNPVE